MATRRARKRQIPNAITAVAGVIAAIIGLHIVFVLLEANPSNGLVETVADWASWFARWAEDLFTPGDAKVRVLVNFGLAAAVYLLVGRILADLARRL